MGLMLLKKDSMKESSLGAYFKKDTGKIDILILYLFLLVSSISFIIIFNLKAILVPVFMIISAVISVNKSTKELGGMSGDSAGYGLVIAEVVGILFLAAII